MTKTQRIAYLKEAVKELEALVKAKTERIQMLEAEKVDRALKELKVGASSGPSIVSLPSIWVPVVPCQHEMEMPSYSVGDFFSNRCKKCGMTFSCNSGSNTCKAG
jgi:hypothetical protein